MMFVNGVAVVGVWTRGKYLVSFVSNYTVRKSESFDVLVLK